MAVARTESPADAAHLLDMHLRLSDLRDRTAKINRSVVEAGGRLLIVSNFTLYGDCTKGRRPGFDLAAAPEEARSLYEYFLEKLRSSEIPLQAGVFQASMAVHLVNDGPVTLLLESKGK